MKRNRGFTLMEMLIVVAIIAVLAAIAIPVFNGSLHKAKVAADMANVRAYYAELQTQLMLTGEADQTNMRFLTEITFADGTVVPLQAGTLGGRRTLRAIPASRYAMRCSTNATSATAY